MDALEPCPVPGQKRTALSYLFPNNDQVLSRRAKFTDDIDTATASAPPPVVAADDHEKPKIEEGLIEQINGPYTGEEPKALPRTLGRFGAFFNMIAFSFALGVLSIPMAVATIGIVPFILQLSLIHI